MCKVNVTSLLAVAVTAHNHIKEGGLVLQGTGRSKLVVVHRDCPAELRSEGGQLVQIVEEVLDTKPYSKGLGVLFVNVRPVTRQDLQGCTGLDFSDNRFFTSTEEGMIERTYPWRLDWLNSHIVYYRRATRILLARLWAFSELSEDEIIKFLTCPLVSIPCDSEYMSVRNRGTATPDYRSHFRLLFEEGSWQLYDCSQLPIVKDVGNPKFRREIAELNRKEARYQEARTKQAELNAGDPLWRWLQTQNQANLLRIAPSMGAVNDPLEFFSLYTQLTHLDTENDQPKTVSLLG